MMIGSSPATALVAYRGVVRAVPRDAVQPVPQAQRPALQEPSRERVRVFGMPGAIVDLIA